MEKTSVSDHQSELFHTCPCEPQSHIETILIEAFSSLQSKLKPPFPPSLLSPTEYIQFNRALLHGILTQPPLARTHFTHLCAIAIDGYEFFVGLLLKMVNGSYMKLLQPVKAQLIWVCDRLIDAEATGIDNLLVSLLRQIIGGDYSSENLWLSNELILIFRRNWDWVSRQEFLVGASLYSFLRLLADHYRLASQSLDSLKQNEIEFCIMVLRKHFGLCLNIGRELIRLLQDVVFIPEFRILWKDLLTNPSSFGVLGFSDMVHIYQIRTSTEYLSLRITPEMETNLRFLLTNVKWGNQKRYQVWFKSKFLGSLEKETLVPDLVRFICCAVHPSIETLKSNVISRWAVIGWLLKCCIHRHYYEANTKLAIFYDWLFFDERIDDFLNLEPAILLIVSSIPQYVDITNTLLEFLFLVMDNYDIGRRDIIVNGVSNSFTVLVKRGLVDLMKLSSCSLVSPYLRDRLKFFSEGQSLCGSELLPRKKSGVLVPLDENNSTSFPFKPMDDNGNNKMLCITTLIDKLGEFFMQSRDRGLEILEKLVMWMTLNELPKRSEENIDLDPYTVAERITNASKVNDSEIFLPLKDDPNNSEDDEVRSATAIIIRAFLLSNSDNLKKMMLFWFRSGLPVGSRLLSYASRLAYEAQMASKTKNVIDKLPLTPAMSIDNQGNGSAEDTASGKQFMDRTTKSDLLEWHVDGHNTFARAIEKSPSGMSHQETSKKSISQLVEDAFFAYTSLLGLFRMQMLNKNHSDSISKTNDVPSSFAKGMPDLDECLTVLLVSNLSSSCAWQPSKVSMLFCSVFDHVPRLSTCKSDVIHLLVGTVDHEHLVSMQFKVGLKKLTIFGNNMEAICSLVRISLTWNSLEQQRFWSLLTSELMVSKGEVPKILLKFCSQFFDPQSHFEALFGLFTLVRSQTPTPDLINALLLYPQRFGEFSAAILASWTASSGSVLFSSLKEWLQGLPVNGSRTSDVPGSKFSADKINGNAILEFLCFLDMLHYKPDMQSSKSDCISEVRGELLKLVKNVDSM